MRLQQAKQIADRVKSLLAPYCDKIEIAGSIRRRTPDPKDIDIVLIPNKDKALMMDGLLSTLGVRKLNGTEIKRLLLPTLSPNLPQEYIALDIYIATPSNWATILLIRTGSKDNNIRLATIAKAKGWQLKANGEGLIDEHGNRIAGDTEQSIYHALRIPYQEPEDRN